MTDKFKLEVIVPVKLIGTVIELLNGEGMLISCSPFNESHLVRSSSKSNKTTHQASAPSPQKVLITMRSKPLNEWHIDAIRSDANIPAGTVSSSLCYLQKAGLVERVRKGMWQLTGRGRE